MDYATRLQTRSEDQSALWVKSLPAVCFFKTSKLILFKPCKETLFNIPELQDTD